MRNRDLRVSFEDKEEEDAITKFITETCCCTLGPKKTPCSKQFSLETITLIRNNDLQMTSSELELVVMAQLYALHTNASSHQENAENFRPFTRYLLHGLQICKMFLFVHAIGKKRLKNMSKAFDRQGVVQRVHGNVK